MTHAPTTHDARHRVGWVPAAYGPCHPEADPFCRHVHLLGLRRSPSRRLPLVRVPGRLVLADDVAVLQSELQAGSCAQAPDQPPVNFLPRGFVDQLRSLTVTLSPLDLLGRREEIDPLSSQIDTNTIPRPQARRPRRLREMRAGS